MSLGCEIDGRLKMIDHETKGMNQPIGSLASLAERLQKHFSILVVAKDWLAPVAAIHDMINGSGILHAKLSGHLAILSQHVSRINRNISLCGTDPLLTPFCACVRVGDRLAQGRRAGVDGSA